MILAGTKIFSALRNTIAGFFVFFATARAVETGSIFNTTDPGNAPWNYVGSISGGASGVYLGAYGGNFWVLTAAHVGAGDFILGGTTYNAVSGSSFSVTNGDSSLADLTLFRISGNPGLANLPVASSAPATSTAVEMIGFGGGKSWGTNTIFAYTNYTLSGLPYGGSGIVTLASNGGQGVGGDSGGGLFAQSSGTWYLAGILSGVGPISSGGTNFGDGTLSVNFAAYYSQISADIGSVSAIPEPSSVAMITGLGALLCGVVARRRSSHR